MTTYLDLKALNANQGFSITNARLSTGAYSWKVSAAGDINGDGYYDIIIGDMYASPSGKSNAGISYIIFGKANGFENIDLDHLELSQGFSISGASENGYVGGQVINAGDINGDGYSDVMITGSTTSYCGWRGSYCHSTMKFYVIFGKSTGFTHLNLDNLSLEQGCTTTIDSSGIINKIILAAAGDVNGDGYPDVIIGAPDAYSNSGRSYVIFGTTISSSNININLDTLSLSQGFSISGAEPSDYSGCSVNGADDLNGDGYDDIIIGAYNANPPTDKNKAGTTYIIFGKSSNFSNINLASLTLYQGFAIYGAVSDGLSGYSVSRAGDINNDGYADIIIGAPSIQAYGSKTGASYIIFGHSGNFNNIDLLSLTSAQGFVVYGSTTNNIGCSVTNAGDINGDGYSDIIINTAAGNNIIFGKKDGYSELNLNDLSLDQGFSISFLKTNPQNNYDQSSLSCAQSSGAGDINGDGFDDIIIGSHMITYPSIYSSYDAGSYVVFGAASGFVTNAPSFAPTTLSTEAPTQVPILTISPTKLPTQMPTSTPTFLPSIGIQTYNPQKEEAKHNIFIELIIGGSVVVISAAAFAIYFGYKFLYQPEIKFFPLPISEENDNLAFSSELKTMSHDIIMNYMQKHNTKLRASIEPSSLNNLIRHTYNADENITDLYQELLSNNNITKSLLTYAAEMILANNNNSLIIFADNIPSSYNVDTHFITVRLDINTKYIHAKTIFMHEITHMVFGDIIKNINSENIINACKTTEYSLISYVAEIMQVENNVNLTSLINSLKYSTELDLFYLKSNIQNTIEHKYEIELINRLADMLNTSIKNEEELVHTSIPQIINKYSLNAEQIYFLERMADYINGIEKNDIYTKNSCEEIAARCIEFTAAELSNEILNLCRPIEDLLI